MRRAAGIVALAAGVSLVPSTAHAYRPFDGTDADVTDLGVFELELAPVGFDAVASRAALVAPNTVLNLGIFDRTELVADIDESIVLGRLTRGAPRTELFGADVFVKHVIRRGVLQDEDGPSIAAEGGLLLPQINGIAAYGGSLDVITSYRWPWASVHWNEWFQWNREQRAELFTGVILEGPHGWTVRPVGEFFYDQEFGGEAVASALLGAIWTLADDLTLDAGARAARDGSATEIEARLGFTWATPLTAAGARPR
jgi:hypothetical protein